MILFQRSGDRVGYRFVRVPKQFSRLREPSLRPPYRKQVVIVSFPRTPCGLVGFAAAKR